MKTATALSGAERAARAGERLAEARGQLADVQGRLAQAQGALDALSRLEASAQAYVTAAERAADEAAAAIVDARAGALVAAGSADEASAEAAHTAAQGAHSTARARLDEARRALEATRAKVQAEGATIREQMQADDEERRGLARLVASLERNQKAAHADAGRERLLAAKERHQALHTRIAEYEQGLRNAQADLDALHDETAAIAAAHPELVTTREFAEVAGDDRLVHEICNGYAGYLSSLARWSTHPHHRHQRFNSQALAQLLTARHISDYGVLESILAGRSGQYGSHLNLATGVLHDIHDAVAKLDAERARELDKLPSVAAEE